MTNTLTQTKIAAVFDVDRTLLPRTTTERLFIRYLVQKRVIGLRTVAAMGLYLLVHAPRIGAMEAIRRRRVYLAGLPVARVKALALQCYTEVIQPRIPPAARRAVADHKAQGHLTVLLSGSLDFLIAPVQADLGADFMICTHMEEKAGRFTGRIAGTWPYGPTKALLTRQFAEEHGVDFAGSYAYADHHTDEEVLALVGNPVVISPKAKMQAIAARRGWTIRHFE
jgi:HAD superfamily hydrolase (TIGR01490 family)